MLSDNIFLSYLSRLSPPPPPPPPLYNLLSFSLPGLGSWVDWGVLVFPVNSRHCFANFYSVGTWFVCVVVDNARKDVFTFHYRS